MEIKDFIDVQCQKYGDTLYASDGTDFDIRGASDLLYKYFIDKHPTIWELEYGIGNGYTCWCCEQYSIYSRIFLTLVDAVKWFVEDFKYSAVIEEATLFDGGKTLLYERKCGDSEHKCHIGDCSESRWPRILYDLREVYTHPLTGERHILQHLFDYQELLFAYEDLTGSKVVLGV